jgi:hypothetical protein
VEYGPQGRCDAESVDVRVDGVVGGEGIN